jgi:hypothetical protein
MSLIFNANLYPSESRKLENFLCQEFHIVKIGNNFVNEHIDPSGQETTSVGQNSRARKHAPDHEGMCNSRIGGVESMM